MNTFTMRHHSDKLGDPSYLFFSYSVKKMYFLRKFCFLSKKNTSSQIRKQRHMADSVSDRVCTIGRHLVI